MSFVKAPTMYFAALRHCDVYEKAVMDVIFQYTVMYGRDLHELSPLYIAKSVCSHTPDKHGISESKVKYVIKALLKRGFIKREYKDCNLKSRKAQKLGINFEGIFKFLKQRLNENTAWLFVNNIPLCDDFSDTKNHQMIPSCDDPINKIYIEQDYNQISPVESDVKSKPYPQGVIEDCSHNAIASYEPDPSSYSPVGIQSEQDTLPLVSEIQPGDRIMTKNGMEIVKAIAPGNYSDIVYIQTTQGNVYKESSVSKIEELEIYDPPDQLAIGVGSYVTTPCGCEEITEIDYGCSVKTGSGFYLFSEINTPASKMSPEFLQEVGA